MSRAIVEKKRISPSGPRWAMITCETGISVPSAPRIAVSPFHTPRRIDLAQRPAYAFRFRRAGQFASGGVQVGDRSCGVGHAYVVAGRLEDLHQARALLFRDADALALARLRQGASYDRAEPPHVVLQDVVGRAEPDRFDRPLLADR